MNGLPPNLRVLPLFLLALAICPGSFAVETSTVGECVHQILESDEGAEATLARRGIPKPARSLQDSFQVCSRLDGTLVCRSFLGEATGADVEIAHFLKDVYVDADGNVDRLFLFDELVLVPLHVLKRRMLLQGRRLMVGVPWSVWHREYVLPSAIELRRFWDEGHHLFHPSRQIRRSWPQLNPLGNFRIDLRRGLRKTREKLVSELETLATLEPEARHKVLLRLVEDLPGAEKKITEFAGEALERLLKNLIERCRQGSTADAVEESLFFRAAHQSLSRHDIHIFSLIAAYGNLHQIHVNVMFDEREEVVTQPETQLGHRVRVTGLVFAGFTIDEIQVRLHCRQSILGRAFWDSLSQMVK